MEKIFKTNGTCSRQISFDYDEDHTIHNIKFVGGCPGNLQAISKICEGMKMEQVASIFEGNTCGAKPTSCADQLAIAIKEVLQNA